MKKSLLVICLVVCLAALIPLAIIGGGLLLYQRAADEGDVAAEVVACSVCLPAGLTLDTVFSDAPQPLSPKGDRRATTVREKLLQLRARCSGGRIYDSRGREIRFYRMQEWGNPPADYQEVLERERRELEELEKSYTVVKMYATVVPF